MPGVPQHRLSRACRDLRGDAGLGAHRRLIVERAPAADIERVAVEEGMDTLWTAALHRVVRGEVSVDEMLRVVT